MLRRWLLVAALAGWLVSCKQIPELKLPEPAPKGLEFTVGMLGPPETVLSTVRLSPQEAEVAGNLYRPLWDYDAAWQAVPVMADAAPEYKMLPDGRSVSTRLRPEGGFPWSDGAPVQLTDFDTAYHLDAYPPKGRSEVSWHRSIKTLDLSQGTLTARLNGFWPLGGLALLPFPSQAAEQLKADDPLGVYGHHPITNGPYVVSNWVGDGRLVTLVPNSHFPFDPEVEPIPTIRYRFYDEVDRMVLGIKKGDVQLAPRVDPRVLAEVKENAWLKPRWVASNRLQALVLRLDSPLLSEPELRRALFVGLKRANWVPGLYQGAEIQPARSWAPDAAWFFLNVLDRVEEESDAAKMLEKAGWSGHPVRRKGKLTLKLELIYDGRNPRAVQTAEQIVNAWRRLDIEVTSIPVDNLSERLRQRDFVHLALAELPLEPWMSPGQIMGKAGLPSEKNPEGLNYSGWLDDGNQLLCDDIDKKIDPVDLKVFLASQQQRFAEEMPFFPLFFVPDVHLVSPQLDGYAPRAFGPASYNSQEWTYKAPKKDR